MPVDWHRPRVTIATISRNTLAQALQKDVDAILKDLKFCSRRLKTALDGFKDELRVLERLYYKCKNQHRMALFFKRVPEMRRFGRRLSELDILEHVDLLRASFVGLEHTNDLRALRGSWSHIPQKPHVDFLTERLTACSTLVCKMRERLEKAYHHFTLAMQTGAFVQFIVLFVAISSRMSALSLELVEALQLGILACNRLLVTIHPMGAQQLPPEPVASHPSHFDYDIPSEDTGQTISRHEPIDTSAPTVEDLSMKMDATSEERVATPPSHPTNGSVCNVAQVPKKASTRVAQKPRVKKARKKLDEIDEIFGF